MRHTWCGRVAGGEQVGGWLAERGAVDGGCRQEDIEFYLARHEQSRCLNRVVCDSTQLFTGSHIKIELLL